MSDFGNMTLSRPRLFGSSLCRITVPALLAVFCVNVNGSLNASNGGPAPRAQVHSKPEQSSDSAPGQSQQSEQGTSPTSSPKPVLTDGTAVRLKFVRAVVSSQVIAGEKVALEVAEPVLVGKLVAIPQQSAQEATVTMAQGGRAMGRGGNLQLKIENVRLADGELVPVRAVKDVKGEVPKAVRIATFPVWSYLIGKSATVPAGAEITAYIAGDFPMDPSKFQTAATSPQEKSAPK